MVKFKEYFRNTDVLLIDDIQFMNGKEAMQEEFFHTFNALLDKGSQIIVSADRPPSKLVRIQERIKSRFSGGLVVDIQNPDKDLLFKLINKYLFLKSITVQEQIIIEVMKYIERTYLAAYEAAKTINQLLYENNHNINLSLIRKHYEQI